LDFINSLQSNQSGEIDSQLFFKIKSMLIDKLRDSSTNVQQAAIRASKSLQEPQAISCSIIEDFVFLLKNDSNIETRLLILETIVINQKTFNLIKNELFYDTEIKIRNKALSLFEKKIPVSFIDSKLKKIIFDCLLRNKNIAMIERFLKSFSENLNIEEFIISLDLRKNWFVFDDLSFNYEKLLTIMNILFCLKESLAETAISYNSLFSEENMANMFDSLNFSFHVYALFFHLKIIGKIDELSFFKKKLLDSFEITLLNELSCYKTKEKILVLINTINAYYILNEDMNLNKRYFYLQTLKFESDCQYIVEAVLHNLKKNEMSKIIELICSDLSENLFNDEYEKYLTTLCIIMSKINLEEFDSLETDNDINLIEHIVINVIPKFISHSEINIRALSVRCIGLAAIISEYIAESYVGFLVNILIIDKNIVIQESLKALFNVLFVFYDGSKNNNEVWDTILIGLENQLESIVLFSINY